MSSHLQAAIELLNSSDSASRTEAAAEIYRQGCAAAEQAVREWLENAELGALLLAPKPVVTVGLAVKRETFSRIRVTHGTPRLSDVPPDQDAEEFELHLDDGVSLDILTSREPGGSGAIAKYLAKHGEGIQQVEYQCVDVDRATAILREQFKKSPVYPEARPGADGTRINFFLVAIADGSKVLIELYETPRPLSPAARVAH
jgi:hypothetical protein